jgi:hypothetical protein
MVADDGLVRPPIERRPAPPCRRIEFRPETRLCLLFDLSQHPWALQSSESQIGQPGCLGSRDNTALSSGSTSHTADLHGWAVLGPSPCALAGTSKPRAMQRRPVIGSPPITRSPATSPWLYGIGQPSDVEVADGCNGRC